MPRSISKALDKAKSRRRRYFVAAPIPPAFPSHYLLVGGAKPLASLKEARTVLAEYPVHARAFIVAEVGRTGAKDSTRGRSKAH